MVCYSRASLVTGCSCESQSKERLLFQFMRLRGAGCGAGACGTLDGAKVEPPGFREALESRQNVACRSHVPGFFLHPDDFARVGMFFEGSGAFRARHRVQLVKKENGGIGVLVLGARRAGDAAAAFSAQLVAHFSPSGQTSASVLHFAVGNKG